MGTAAQIKRLSVVFQTETEFIDAVDDVSFELHAGETLALLGESGCGKSLTSLALMRLLPPGAVYGKLSEVWLYGEDVLTLPEQGMRAFRGRRLAIIFQEPMTALNPVLTIGTQLYEALQRDKSMTRAALKARMLQLLEDVEMPEPARRLKQYPHQLSGGQKQRVMIAMALAGNPDVLIADEPTTALDVTIQAQILALLKKLQQRYNMSLLLITHDLGVVKASADRVCVMYAGHIVEIASVTEFFHRPLHPYAQQLLMSMPTIEKRHTRLEAIGGQVPALDKRPSGCRFHPRCAHVFEPCADEVPLLQTLQGTRMVRCHLYPEHEFPPALSVSEPLDIQTTPMGERMLLVQDLTICYADSNRRFLKRRGTFKAVEGLSFELHQGQTLALVGESGCGKTTTAKALLKLLPAAGGQMLFHGQEIGALKGRALRAFRKQVQLIFQDPFSSMNPRMTVGDIISEGMRAQGMPARMIHKRQRQLLEQVHLPVRSLERYPHQFSGGQRQRIGIARALAGEPELLICDEPTSALDISVQAQVLNLLKELQRDMGLSYLFITHNMGVVAYMADEVLVMRAGKVVERNGCEALFKAPAHPYTRQLLRSVLS